MTSPNRLTWNDVWIESDHPLSSSPEWSVPLRLMHAIAERQPLSLEPISPLLAANLETLRNVFAEWVGGKRVPLAFAPTKPAVPASNAVSLFFSGGVDSFYSLLTHRDEIDNLILVHGFDMPLAATAHFALAEAQARDVARSYGKRLILVRTNMHWEQPSVPGRWGMYHGPAMAAVALALAPAHRKTYIASTDSYTNMRPWGSHPILDHLWSTEAVRIVHDTPDPRMDKLRLLIQEPDVLSRLRVCMENQGILNCGVCEKCVRTRLGLCALGIESLPTAPGALTARLVESQDLVEGIEFWREFLGEELPPALMTAVQSAILGYDAGLPPRNGKLKREVKRCLFAARSAARAIASPFQ